MNVAASSSTASASSSNGLSGLISGIDTDSMVESMLSGLQTQIDTQKQEKQVLEWKQEQYREVITKINDFQDKYFSLTSENSLRSTTLFNSSKAESSSSAVKIISSKNSAEHDFSVGVQQLASAASITSKQAVSTKEIKFNDANVKEYKRTAKFSYKTDDKDADGNAIYKDIEIDFSSSEFQALKDADGKFDKQKFAELLNQKLDGSGITVEYTAKNPDDENSVDTLEFKSSVDFKVSGSTVGLGMLGCSGKTATADEKENESDPDSFSMKSGNFNPDIAVKSSVKISLDGVGRNFILEEGQSLYDIKDDIKKAFGTGIEVSQDADGNTILKGSSENRSVSVSATDEVLETLGMKSTNSATNISLSTKLSEFRTSLLGSGESVGSGKLTINGVDIEYSADDTVSQVMSKINNSSAGVSITYNSLSDAFSIKNKSTGADFALTVNDDGNFLKSIGFESSNTAQGTNAKFTIDGSTVERAGNNIEYNGVTFELKNVTTQGEATISASKNTDKIVSTIKNFVDDYNKLIEELNKYTHQKAEYKSYAPLTDAQKKEMTEREIELWEEKSKTGLLRNDSDISSFLQDMRAAFYTKGKDSNIVCSNIGIDSSSNWQDYGKLSVDEDVLKKALESNAEEIANMFTNVNSGLATRLNNICKSAANTSSGSPGSLVSLAGVVGKATEKENIINDQLDAIAEKLERLNERYESRKTKYWKMFNSMETTLSDYQSQSNYLYNMGY